MPIQGIATTVFIESQRLKCFLERNQLVQANAKAEKLEGIIQDCLVRDGGVPEQHHYWPMFKTILRIKSYILSGKRDEAEQEAATFQTIIKTSGEKPCQP